jgi:hypothetical protein
MIPVELLVMLLLLKSNQEIITSVISPARKQKLFILMELVPILATSPTNIEENSTAISVIIPVPAPLPSIIMGLAYLLVFILLSTTPSTARNTVKFLVKIPMISYTTTKLVVSIVLLLS